MELEVLQENLNKGLSLVSRVLASRPQIVILSNILLRASSGRLEIVASNLETTIVVSIGAKVEVSGEFTVPGRTFLEVIGGLAAQKIALKLIDGSLSITGGKFKAKINGSPATEFPKLTPLSEDSKVSWELEKKSFTQSLNRIVFVAASDESRMVLTGVLFNSSKDGLTLAATDGFRLSVIKLPVKSETDTKFIVSAKALVEVIRVSGESESIKLTYLSKSNQVVFDFGEVQIYSRLISGNFPDYEKIIPPSSTTKIVVTVDELLKAIRLASVFARDSANIVKLKLVPGKLKISANAPQVGEQESEVDIQAEKGSDEEFTIAFNFHYLLDLLSSLGGSEVTAEFTGPLASGVFRIPKDSNFLHLIMPVRVQGD